MMPPSLTARSDGHRPAPGLSRWRERSFASRRAGSTKARSSTVGSNSSTDRAVIALEARIFPELLEDAELSPRTFWTFAREFSSFRRQGAANGRATLIPDTVLPVSLVRRAVPGSPELRLQTHGPAGPGGRKAVSTRWSRGRVD